MFFHPILLQPQHQMQLLIPWLVSTRGLKKVKNEDIMKCNVIKICDHIHSFLVSNSRNPNKRFSLRLSSFLINGLCMIFREQVVLLQRDIDRILVARQKVADRLLDELRADAEIDGASPKPKPTIKKSRKTRKPQQDTPESLVERIGPVIRGRQEREPEFNLDPLRVPDLTEGDLAVVQARVSDITIREETARPAELRLLDDFGPIGETAASTNVADVQISSNILEEPRLEQEIVSQSAIPVEELLRQEVLEQDVPQIRIEEIPEIVEPPPGKEPAIQVVPEIVVIPVPQSAEEHDKGKEPAVKKKDKRTSSGQKTKPVDELAQLEVVQPVVGPKEATKKGRKNIAASLLLKKKKGKFVPINQPMQIYKDEPVFTIISKTIPDFKPIEKFWPEWEQQMLHPGVDDVRPSRDTGSARDSGIIDRLTVTNKTAETPEASAVSLPLMHQEGTPLSEVPIAGPTYVSTPRKRLRARDETVEESMPSAANGEMGPPPPERKRKKVVTVEELQAAEQPPKEDGRPEDQILQEHEIQQSTLPEEQVPFEIIGPSDIGEITRPKPARKEKSPENRVPRVVEEEITSSPAKETFGVEWSREIMAVIYKYEQISPVDICKKFGKRISKLNMSIIFSTLLYVYFVECTFLALAKDRFVRLRSAEDSSELRFAEKGPKEYV